LCDGLSVGDTVSDLYLSELSKNKKTNINCSYF